MPVSVPISYAEALRITEEAKKKLRDHCIAKGIKFHCSLCNKEEWGFGNNPAPLPGDKCCDECNNTKVMPARFAELSKRRMDDDYDDDDDDDAQSYEFYNDSDDD